MRLRHRLREREKHLLAAGTGLPLTARVLLPAGHTQFQKTSMSHKATLSAGRSPDKTRRGSRLQIDQTSPLPANLSAGWCFTIWTVASLNLFFLHSQSYNHYKPWQLVSRGKPHFLKSFPNHLPQALVLSVCSDILFLNCKVCMVSLRVLAGRHGQQPKWLIGGHISSRRAAKDRSGWSSSSHISLLSG